MDLSKKNILFSPFLFSVSVDGSIFQVPIIPSPWVGHWFGVIWGYFSMVSLPPTFFFSYFLSFLFFSFLFFSFLFFSFLFLLYSLFFVLYYYILFFSYLISYFLFLISSFLFSFNPHSLFPTPPSQIPKW